MKKRFITVGLHNGIAVFNRGNSAPKFAALNMSKFKSDSPASEMVILS